MQFTRPAGRTRSLGTDRGPPACGTPGRSLSLKRGPCVTPIIRKNGLILQLIAAQGVTAYRTSAAPDFIGPPARTPSLPQPTPPIYLRPSAFICGFAYFLSACPPTPLSARQGASRRAGIARYLSAWKQGPLISSPHPRPDGRTTPPPQPEARSKHAPMKSPRCARTAPRPSHARLSRWRQRGPPSPRAPGDSAPMPRPAHQTRPPPALIAPCRCLGVFAVFAGPPLTFAQANVNGFRRSVFAVFAGPPAADCRALNADR